MEFPLLTRSNVIRLTGWRSFLVIAAVCSLTVTVVTRYCADDFGSAGTHTVKTRLAQPKVQRLVMAKDVAQGLPRAARIAVVTVSSYQSPVGFDSAPILLVDVGDAVSDRAPPFTSLL